MEELLAWEVFSFCAWFSLFWIISSFYLIFFRLFVHYILRRKFWLVFKKLKLPRKCFLKLHTSLCYEKYIKLYPLWFWCVNEIWSECQILLIFGGALTLSYISFFCLFLHFVLFSLFSWLISNLQKLRHTDCSIVGGALSLRSIFFLCLIFIFLDYFNFLAHVF